MSDAPWDAYRDAVVEIDLPSGRVRVEPRLDGQVGEFPFGREVVHVIAAFADSQRSDDNLRRHTCLAFDVDSADLRSYRAVGGDPTGAHTEVSVAVLGLSDQAAIELGRRYQQDAIFRWTRDSFAIVGCADGAVENRGWTIALPLFGAQILS